MNDGTTGSSSSEGVDLEVDDIRRSDGSRVTRDDVDAILKDARQVVSDMRAPTADDPTVSVVVRLDDETPDGVVEAAHAESLTLPDLVAEAVRRYTERHVDVARSASLGEDSTGVADGTAGLVDGTAETADGTAETADGTDR